MAHFFTQVSLKMVVFTDSENIKEVFFLTPFGFSRRQDRKWIWVSIADQESLDKATQDLQRFEVDWRCHRVPAVGEYIPKEHEIVEGLDSGRVLLSEYKRFLDNPQAPNEPLFPDTYPAPSRILPFVMALELNDHTSARVRFISMCESIPANEASKMGLANVVSESFIARGKSVNPDPFDHIKLEQLSATLASVLAACCDREWLMLLKTFGESSFPKI